ncbi:death 3-like isoform X4 [Octopus vulgaris]|uniref:Death 3-like isoform X4 n=1 Tax=Octopus vulgaris TaxID=6645 RepID=A0AA36FGC4_OCTVU|nr:death 3-like isoform X4 [Octopus vulgaris]
MSSSKEKLLNYRPFIVKNLVSIEDVVDTLISDGILTTSVNEDIKSCENEDNKIRKLLDFLVKKDKSEFNMFCSALNSTGNEHIALKLTSDGPLSKNETAPSLQLVNKKRTIMDDKDKDILRKLRVQFVKNMIDVEGVVDILFSEDVIKDSHKSLILRHLERSKQIRNLLDILPKRFNNTMSIFIKALEETDNIVLINKIKELRHV